METSTLLFLAGGAFLVWKFLVPGVAVSNLIFLENGMSLDISNPLRVVINLSVIVQNPTSGSLTLNSMAGYFYVNGSQTGNVSYFTPTVINPNSQTQIQLQLSVNDISLVSDIMSYINSGTGSLAVEIKGTANVNNVPVPIDLSFQPM
jgi:LEA14-like dessication related protein